jgi:hypothetical protein
MSRDAKDSLLSSVEFRTGVYEGKFGCYWIVGWVDCLMGECDFDGFWGGFYFEE